MDIKNLNLNNEKFSKFIEECETNIIAAPENFASSVMARIAKINQAKSVKVIPFISRKMRAALCFCSAFAVMAMAYFGVNDKISEFFSTVATPDKIQKIGEFLNQIKIFNLN